MVVTVVVGRDLSDLEQMQTEQDERQKRREGEEQVHNNSRAFRARTLR